MEYKTFNEWNSIGRMIKKGEKSTRIDGLAKFTKDQTYVFNKTLYESKKSDIVSEKVFVDITIGYKLSKDEHGRYVELDNLRNLKPVLTRSSEPF